MTALSDQIHALRAQGMTYTQITDRLQCSKATVSYHLGVGQKEKNKARTEARRSISSLVIKLDRFKSDPRLPKEPHEVKASISQQYRDKLGCFNRTPSGVDMPKATEQFNLESVVNKFGESPECYLTGDAIDYDTPSSFHFDHVYPRSRGGDSSLDNLGLATAQANRLKGDLTLDELFTLCEKILRKHGRI